MRYLSLIVSALAANVAAKKVENCNIEALRNIDVRGLSVIDLQVREVNGFTEWSNNLPHTFLPLPVKESGSPIDYCSVIVSYTHGGLDDHIASFFALPLDDSTWNGRLLGEGGGGWTAGVDGNLNQGVALGYATMNTDGGHQHNNGFAGVLSAEEWALPSTGNIDWTNLQNFASRALDDLPKIGKQVVKAFYGKEPKKTYWQGCSTGGRQGLMSVQRFPNNYDGVLSVAPAINWATFLMTEQYPQLAMRKEGYLPSQCEFGAISAAAMEACDELDGVKDNLISAPGLCTYDANDAVGRAYECGKEKGKVSQKAATIANDIWAGPKKDGKNEWFGSTHEMPFGGPGPIDGLANTACNDKGKECKAAPFPISAGWVKDFVVKDADYDPTSFDEAQFWKYLSQSRKEFSSIMGTDDPDVSDFKKAGGKVIMWHGLADQLIFPNGSSNYYERVEALDPDVRSFFRHFEVPGLLHCAGGKGAFPSHALDALVQWVEKGKAPEKLDGVTEKGGERIHCVYPLVAAFKGGDPDKKESYECAESFDKYKSQWGAGKSEL